MSLLPIIRSADELSPRHLQRGAQAQRNTELAIFQHGLGARFKAEVDRIDTQAIGDALRASLDEELDLLNYGLAHANGSPAKAELVARKVEMLANINNRRISRRFGE